MAYQVKHDEHAARHVVFFSLFHLIIKKNVCQKTLYSAAKRNHEFTFHSVHSDLLFFSKFRNPPEYQQLSSNLVVFVASASLVNCMLEN